MPLALLPLLSLAMARGPAPHADPGPHAGEPDTPRVVAVDSIALTVNDLDTSVEWYTRILDFREVSRRDLDGEPFERLVGVFGARARIATLALADERIDLIDFITPDGRPMPPDSASRDHWFQHVAIIVSDMHTAVERLESHNVRRASFGPQRLPDWNPNAAGIEAMYFRDPDGHFLEILHFPSGKGDPRWHAPADRLFLGIDHTAIVTHDTEASLRFYRDTLGLRVAGHSDNYGIEQERLNAVFGARLRITSLRADSGPAVELLEYRTPRGGRPAPADSTPADLWHWHITMRTDYSDALPTPLPAADPNTWPDLVESGHGSLVTAAPVDADLPDLTSGPALLARDPTGHAILLHAR